MYSFLLYFEFLNLSYWLHFLHNSSNLSSLQWWVWLSFLQISFLCQPALRHFFSSFSFVLWFSAPHSEFILGFYWYLKFLCFIFCCCFLIKLFMFDKHSSHEVLRKNTKRSHVSFPVSPLLTSCKTVMQCHTQDTDIDTVTIRDNSVSFLCFVSSPRPRSPWLCLPFVPVPWRPLICSAVPAFCHCKNVL